MGEMAEADPLERGGKGRTEAMRRLLRKPRYFDDDTEDFEQAGARCFRCGKVGHKDKECNLPAKERPCYFCGQFGHRARDCTNNLCFNCCRVGHLARQCRRPQHYPQCIFCGSKRHASEHCVYDVSEEDAELIRCFTCHRRGHLACMEKSINPIPQTCFRCGSHAHSGFDCHLSPLSNRPPLGAASGRGQQHADEKRHHHVENKSLPSDMPPKPKRKKTG